MVFSSCCVLPFLFINLFIIYPCVPPNIIVIIEIGSNEIGSFQPIRMALGNNTRNAIRMPFIIKFIFNSVLAVKNPMIIHIDKAERLASQVRFITIIGIMSINPANNPIINPIMLFFISLFYYPQQLHLPLSCIGGHFTLPYEQ